jgi:hypothetical protein
MYQNLPAEYKLKVISFILYFRNYFLTSLLFIGAIPIWIILLDSSVKFNQNTYFFISFYAFFLIVFHFMSTWKFWNYLLKNYNHFNKYNYDEYFKKRMKEEYLKNKILVNIPVLMHFVEMEKAYVESEKEKAFEAKLKNLEEKELPEFLRKE